MQMKVRDTEIEVAIKVSGNGMQASFYAELDGKGFRSETWDGLYKTLMAATKRKTVRVNVPFLKLLAATWNQPTRFESDVATGLHAKTGKPLTPDGQWETSFTGVVYPADLTPSLQTLRIGLQETVVEAHKKILEFDQAHGFNLTSVVRAEVEKKVSEDAG